MSHQPFPAGALRALPKAELHVHLEGTLDIATLLALAERHGMRPPAEDVEGIEAWHRFDGAGRWTGGAQVTSRRVPIMGP